MNKQIQMECLICGNIELIDNPSFADGPSKGCPRCKANCWWDTLLEDNSSKQREVNQYLWNYINELRMPKTEAPLKE